MKWFSNIIIQVIVSLILIYIGHQCYDYLKNKYSKKVVKNMYIDEVGKYKELMDEINKTEMENKIMEDELNQFLENAISTQS